MNICTLLDLVANAGGHSPAVNGPGGELSAAEIQTRAGRAAHWLQSTGRTALIYLGSNDVDLPVALFAAAWAGVPFVPLNFRLGDEQLAGLVHRHPGAAVVGLGDRSAPPGDVEVVSPEQWSQIISHGDSAARWADDGDALAVLLYTSGTTGSPKGVLLRHRNLTAYVLSAVEFLGADGTESTAVSVPPYHIAGIANLLSNLYAGRRIVYLSAFSPDAWISLIEREKVTQAMVVPTMLARIVDLLATRGEAGPASLRTISYGGARTHRAVIGQALACFPNVGFVNAYGLTETSSTIALLGPEDHDAARDGDPAALARLSSVGRILPDVEVAVFDPTGNRLPAESHGEVRVRGAQVSGEYDIGSALDEDGWFSTRDIGWIDGEGYLYIEGRGDDTIIRGGENIAPAEVEAVLREHDAVSDVAVVGVPDREWGQVVGAAVVLRDRAITPEELRLWALERLRSVKAPAQVRVVESLPYSELGKLRRRELVALFDHPPDRAELPGLSESQTSNVL